MKHSSVVKVGTLLNEETDTIYYLHVYFVEVMPALICVLCLGQQTDRISFQYQEMLMNMSYLSKDCSLSII